MRLYQILKYLLFADSSHACSIDSYYCMGVPNIMAGLDLSSHSRRDVIDWFMVNFTANLWSPPQGSWEVLLTGHSGEADLGVGCPEATR